MITTLSPHLKRTDHLALNAIMPPDNYSGITKERIRLVLTRCGVAAPDADFEDMVDAVYALCDNRNGSWYSKARSNYKFCDGASCAFIGAHIGICQRRKSRLDREGRDKWIKPLVEIGAIQKVYLLPRTGEFIPGHQVANSPNNAYRLESTFKQILRAGEDRWQLMLRWWSNQAAIRQRLREQARLEIEASRLVSDKHKNLIDGCVELYIPNFLKDFKIIYRDEGSGKRVKDHHIQNFLGINLSLDGGIYPDIILHNSEENSLWLIEAVTSDGEVDFTKYEKFKELVLQSNIDIWAGATTAFQSFKDASKRIPSIRRIIPDSFVWFMDIPDMHYKKTKNLY